MSPKRSYEPDDWLRVLSILALFGSDVPEGYFKSAWIGAVTILLLTMASSTVFGLFYLGLLGVLTWFSLESGDSAIIGYTIFYWVSGIILLAEAERRAAGHGHFLAAVWWLGQSGIHYLNIRHSHEMGDSEDFFSLLFLVLSMILLFRDLLRGYKDWRLTRKSRGRKISESR